MRRVLQTLAVLAVLAVVAGGAVTTFGLYNVSARSGHFPGVSWLLHTTFRNAVRLRAPAPAQGPDLTDPDLIELGARHYDNACRACHASPGAPRPATMAAMLPAPPPVAAAVRDWQPRHLHWIVANGVKMSGMPAWPAARTDDVWPVVAFLVAVKKGMTAADYAALTAPDQTGRAEAVCTGCHDGDNDHVPRLDGQRAEYLAMSLRVYRDDHRPSGIMAQVTTPLSDAAIDRLARYFAAQESAPRDDTQPLDLVARGAALAQAATGDPDVPACRACHGPGATQASSFFPVLAGQPAPYLRQQLRLWREGGRGGGHRAALMRQAARHLDDDAIDALAAYYASLP